VNAEVVKVPTVIELGFGKEWTMNN
jgi:hypothetical protein